MASLKILTTGIVFALAAAPLAGSAAETPAPAAARPAQALPWDRAMNLQRWASDSFYPDLTAAIDSLSLTYGPRQEVLILDIAELYLTHMLVQEAAEILEGARPENPALEERHRALSDAAQLFLGNQIAFADSPLNRPERPDRAFWASLQAIASSDIGLLERHLAESFAGLGQQSRAVLRQMLPVFTEAAIELGLPDHARGALEVFDQFPDLAGAPVAHYLQGRMEQQRGNDASALEAYLEAVTGWDQWAVRARLAVADMSLENGSEGALLAAQSVLDEGAEAWRGGRFEREVLRRLARVYGARGLDVEELLVLGKLLSRFPNAPSAGATEARVEMLLARAYQRDPSAPRPIGAWMQIHLRLLPYYRDWPAFAAHVETIADHALSLGATDLAVQEYRRARKLLDRQKDLPEAARLEGLVRLDLKIIRGLRLAGLNPEARAVLEEMPAPQIPAQQQELAETRARILSDLDERRAFLAAVVEKPSAEHLRNRGAALAAADDWPGAVGAYLQLWRDFPGRFTADDATYLLIAANRAEDLQTLDRVARAFPSLTSSKEIVELARGINEKAPELMPLHAAAAEERLERLRSTFDLIKNTTGTPAD